MPAARSIYRIRPTSSKRRPNTGPTKPELAARLRRGDTLADAAEYFCVTEDFLRKAYALYRDMGYSFGAEEKA